jgi:hypothetical protein
MKISENVIPFTYQESKRVFENKLSVKEAAENINKNCGIKITSSADYYYYFKHLMTGEGSCRLLNKFTQEYYLEQIEKDFGKEQLKKSLKAFYELIEKFEKENGSTKKSMRAIYEKYIVLV